MSPSTCAAQQFSSAAVETPHVGEGKLDQAALADDLRKGLRDLRQQLVHDVEAVPDVLHRRGIVRDPVVGENENAVGVAAQVGNGRNGSLPAREALEAERLHANHDHFRTRFVAQLDEPLRQGDARGTSQTKNEHEEITSARDRSQPGLFNRDDFPREIDIAIAAEPVDQIVAKQMAIRHDGALDGQLVGIEDPEVLRRRP